MQMKRTKKALSCILCMVLIVAMALFTTGCGNDSKNLNTQESGQSKVTVKGEGETCFQFSVVDQEGNETKFEVHTDKTVVGEALQEVGLIAGNEENYGLYVKTVNGLTLDFNKDGYYWAFYINGEYATAGVDTTTITEGDNYSFKAEK